MRDQPLLEILRDIAVNGPRAVSEGLCVNIHHHSLKLHRRPVHHNTIHTMIELFQLWPEGTKRKDYPVPGVNGNSCQHSFSLYNKWSTRSPYGRLRMRMINWMINELEK